MFPYEIKQVEENLQKELMENFKGERNGYLQVGPKNWFLPAQYAAHAEKFYEFLVKKDDVWLVTFPRAGSTVVQALIWLVCHDLDFNAFRTTSLDEMFPFFEYTILHDEKYHQELRKINNYEPEAMRKLAYWKKSVYDMDITSPRFLKTHLPYSLLPPELTKTCKSIYIARNPKNVAVSYYHHNRLLRTFDFKSDFEKYWGYFENNLVLFSPFWEHLKEGWEQRNNPNVLFIFYEDLIKDMKSCIRRIADFLGKNVSDDGIKKLENFLNIDNFRNAIKIHALKGLRNSGEQGFIRKGKIGGFTEFSENLNNQADEWIKKNCDILDFRFPETDDASQDS